MDIIETYLRDELHLREVDLHNRLEEFGRHPDIAGELEVWINTRQYPSDGIEVDGLTAKDIKAKADFMTGAEAYNFLITMREEPELAQKYIAEGFPVE